MSAAESMLPRLTDAAHEDWCCAKGCTCGDCRDKGGRESDCSCLVRIIERHARAVYITARADGWDQGANDAVEPINTGTRMTLRAILPFPANPYLAALAQHDDACVDCGTVSALVACPIHAQPDTKAADR